MYLPTHNRLLLRGLLAGAVALTGASSCSRSDRSDRGRDTTQVGETGVAVQPDTQPTAANRPSVATQSSAADTVSALAEKKTTPRAHKRSASRPSSQPSVASVVDSTGETSDYGVSGYRAMDDDSAATSLATDSAADTSIALRSDSSMAVAADTSATDTTAATLNTPPTEVAGVADSSTDQAQADTTAAGYAQVTRDTSAAATQSDTAAQSQGNVALQAPGDTAGQADSSTQVPAVVVQTAADTAGVVGDSSDQSLATAGANADTLANPSESDRIRPSQDSSETETASSTEPDTQATGAARTSELATGADAVALMSRQGLRCVVSESDSNRRQWDMASTPATLNPCGLGTMQLSRIWTGEER